MSPQEKSIAIRDKEGRAIAFSQSLYPAVAVIEVFEKHHKGAAGEILSLCKDEQKHVHQAEDKDLDMDKRDMETKAFNITLGMWFAFLLSVLALGGGITLAILDKKPEAWAALVSGLAMVFIAFIRGGKRQ